MLVRKDMDVNEHWYAYMYLDLCNKGCMVYELLELKFHSSVIGEKKIKNQLLKWKLKKFVANHILEGGKM